jgi:uncharacterized protein YbaP (TraB family)
MPQYKACLCVLVFSFSSAVSATQPSQDVGGIQSLQKPAQELEEILVVGERPGPRLWKISWQEHVMWILGTLGPLPTQMTWRSHQVEAVIAESSEVLGPYSVALNVEQADAFRSKGSTLRAVLPAGDYARWIKMKAQYIGDNVNTDALLPTAAALLLQDAAYQKAGLTYTNELWATINRLAEQNDVPVRSLEVVTDWDVAKKGHSLRSIRRGASYLVETMSRVKTNEQSARARANAWAAGDIASLRRLTRTDDAETTLLAASWPFLNAQEAKEIMSHAQRTLVRDLDNALRRNQVTFAAIPISLLFRDHGLLADLRLNGLSVYSPDETDSSVSNRMVDPP